MSLFGNLNNNTTNTNNGGLFGTKPAAATGGGLFGNLNTNTTSQPQSTTTSGGGLFGNSLGGPGLGGSSTAAQPATSNWGMGGNGGNTQQQPPGGSVFGAGTSTQQNNANTMFGGGQIAQAQSTNGLTASTTGPLQQSQNGSQNSAYFDAILERSRKRAHAEAISEDLPQLQLGLGDIRQRIKRLGTGTPDRADGRAHYLLAGSGVDPGAAIRDLNLLTGTNGRTERTQAPEVIDTDVESYIANVQTQTSQTMVADGLLRSVRDFDAFLDDNVTVEWDLEKKNIYQHFGIRPRETAVTGGRGSFAASTTETQGGFGKSRRSKAAALAGSRNGMGGESTFARSNMQKSVIGIAGPVGTGHQPLFADVEKQMETNGVNPAGPHDRYQRDKQNKFAEKVQRLNVARLDKRPFHVAKEFADVTKVAGDQHGPDMVKAYRALGSIVGEDPEATSFAENRTAKERQYAAAYLSETTTDASSKFRSRILRGGASCLEKLAFENMEDMVTRNPRDANLGGVPNVLNKVKAYVRLQAVKKNLSGDNSNLQIFDNDYIYAVIYFLLRSGHVTEAEEYVRKCGVAFRAIDRNFSEYMRSYATSPSRTLDDKLQTKINNEYIQRLRIAPENSIDPYRMACYKIIGRCDLRTRTLDGISQDIEDFAWVQLVLARESNRAESMSTEVYGLTEAQETIREIGTRFFSKAGAGGEIGSSFGAFVFLQIALGMFEEAVAFLYTHSYVDGVHLAIALDFYGVLRVSDPTNGGEDLFSRTTKNQPQISFGSMVGLYTRDFRTANVSAAVDYLVLICLNQDLGGQQGSHQVMLCHEALRELALESREFALLLGDMRGDGQRINGLIEDRIGLIGLQEVGDFMRTITMQAASIADDNGRTTDAVLLFHLATEYDNVVVTINRALSEAVAVPIGQDPLKLQPLKASSATANQQKGTEISLTSIDDPLQLAEIMSKIYADQMYRSKIKLVNQQACDALQQMSRIKTEVEKGEWTRALDVSFLSSHHVPTLTQ